MEDQEMTQKIIGGAMKVHAALGPGFREWVFQKTLDREWRDAAGDSGEIDNSRRGLNIRPRPWTLGLAG